MNIRTCILVLFISCAASVANAGDYAVPKGVTVLTEEQLMTQIIGNTFAGGTKWVEYYAPSSDGQREGRIRGKHRRTGLYGGKWKIDESLMCWEFDDPKWAAYNDCFTIELKGDIVNAYTIRGILHADIAGEITLIPGNPNDL
jgi:hypothetical protein